MACDKGFSSSYMLLKPEEVRFFDLIRILFSSNVEERKFVDYCPARTAAAEDVNFRRRWMIFISILAQKFLLFTSTLLLWFGSGFEMWLNLVSINQNVGRLLLNFFQGQLSTFSIVSFFFFWNGIFPILLAFSYIIHEYD